MPKRPKHPKRALLPQAVIDHITKQVRDLGLSPAGAMKERSKRIRLLSRTAQPQAAE